MRGYWRLQLLFAALTSCLVVASSSPSHSLGDADESTMMELLRLRRATCSAGDCKNGGVCNPISGSAVCLCPEPYSGNYCTYPINYCSLSNSYTGAPIVQCLNGGTCTGYVLTAPYFSCSCMPGFTGSRCETNIDECASHPCTNGQCTDLVNIYSCSCYSGWEGSNCQINHNDCTTGACLNGGRCLDGNSTFTCDCTDTGFSGSRCEKNIDDCSPNPCVNGQCTDLVKDFSCSCFAGWEGKVCSVDTNYCVAGPCQNGGRCSDGNSTFTCDCSATDYNGATCNIICNDCLSNSCLNGGKCSDGVRSYTCNCTDTGFSGSRCETNIDDCSPNPCVNGASCLDGVKNYSCNCLSGYSGRNCTVDFPDCSPTPCQYKGTCLERSRQTLYGNASLPAPFSAAFNYSLAAGFVCICPPGVFGPTCSVNPNDCLSPVTNLTVCVHASGCTDGLNSFTCHCYIGWESQNCSVNHDDCVTGACQNGGRCVDGNATFTCDCSDIDFEGPRCASRINDCLSNYCLNGGSCSDGVRSFSCTCLSGYSGVNCSVDHPDCSPNPCAQGGICFERSNPANYHNSSDMPWPFNAPFSHSLSAGFVCLYPGESLAPAALTDMKSALVWFSVGAVFAVICAVSAFLLILYQYGRGNLSLGRFDRRPGNSDCSAETVTESGIEKPHVYQIPDVDISPTAASAAVPGSSLEDAVYEETDAAADAVQHLDRPGTDVAGTKINGDYVTADLLMTDLSRCGCMRPAVQH